MLCKTYHEAPHANGVADNEIVDLLKKGQQLKKGQKTKTYKCSACGLRFYICKRFRSHTIKVTSKGESSEKSTTVTLKEFTDGCFESVNNQYHINNGKPEQRKLFQSNL